jgi:hypothetical protein
VSSVAAQPKPITSPRDMLLVALDSAKVRVVDAITGISEVEYTWEPLTGLQRKADLLKPPNRKKVWRVFRRGGSWVYDYTPEAVHPPPFITIAWIMNHIAQTAEMYLYCIEIGVPEGVDRSWDDLPVPRTTLECASISTSAWTQPIPTWTSSQQRKSTPFLTDYLPLPGEKCARCT